MSSWKPTPYSTKRLELHWANNTCATHDLFCGCDDPIKHLCEIALKKGGIYNFNSTSIKQLCLQFTTEGTATADHGTTTPGDDHIQDLPDFGDLEKLFERRWRFRRSYRWVRRKTLTKKTKNT